jgi:TonB family protein
MAHIEDQDIYLGALSPERLQLLRTVRILTLRDFFAVDYNSTYYNERSKANVFYAQAWAFVHFMMHGEYADAFKQYLEALTHREVDLFDYVRVNQRDLEFEFQNYLNTFIRFSPRTHIQAGHGTWRMRVESIPEAEAQMTISEIFLANGRLADARRYLEQIVGPGEEFPRASYYRGVLARISGDTAAAREFFIDALLDPQLAARAAVQLVEIRELSIPAVRLALEEAAGAGTRMSDVYWALSEIYLDDLRRIEESIRLSRQRFIPPPVVPAAVDISTAAEPAPFRYYAHASEHDIKYQLWSQDGTGPRVQVFVAPYFPEDLRSEKLSGDVVVDVQIAEGGEVGGIWLISATPEIFGNLATEAVRQWRFEPIPAKIRVVVEFRP